ncbi:ultraviolet-B receptor UVR8 [Pyrus ussuriensis x Pyrus communis]|uniref:Ultraviolet-B receptor UVR8 n=1 Tax=Pyrus ussuriensis x Pyrus communis TaxID=2448454 RepID=A0A5N5FN11_9ROSA|nr:ultraviolet-B receptor UVR8 [Pyrus ussuriensis x Pyrus communis]
MAFWFALEPTFSKVQITTYPATLLTPSAFYNNIGIAVKMHAAGAEHTAAVTEDGSLYGWGWGRYGNLGLGDRNDRLVPEKVSMANVSLKICKYCQLGHGDFEDHLVPHKLEALSDTFIRETAGGWGHTMALTSDGILYGWGWNKFGQVGVGDNIDHCSPVQVKFPHEQFKYLWIETPVSERQNVFSWGRATNGQLGHGESVDRNVPRIIVFEWKTWVSLSERYAVVPDETVRGQASASVRGNGNDASVPETGIKRLRF